MRSGLVSFLRLVAGTLRDLAPIIIIIGFFQIVVLQQPFPNLGSIVVGLVFVMLGLALFIRGLEMALFPLGESLAGALARKGSLFWLMVFSFGLGFGTTVAEPALIAIADEAARTMAGAGAIADEPAILSSYALKLRYTVALSVGVAIMVGVLRILKGWPIQWLIIGGYVLAVMLTAVAPQQIIGIAYDSGGVTTSTITVPLKVAGSVGRRTSTRVR